MEKKIPSLDTGEQIPPMEKRKVFKISNEELAVLQNPENDIPKFRETVARLGIEVSHIKGDNVPVEIDGKKYLMIVNESNFGELEEISE